MITNVFDAIAYPGPLPENPGPVPTSRAGVVEPMSDQKATDKTDGWAAAAFSVTRALQARHHVVGWSPPEEPITFVGTIPHADHRELGVSLDLDPDISKIQRTLIT
jgi:hypothetical protein